MRGTYPQKFPLEGDTHQEQKRQKHTQSRAHEMFWTETDTLEVNAHPIGSLRDQWLRKVSTKTKVSTDRHRESKASYEYSLLTWEAANQKHAIVTRKN